QLHRVVAVLGEGVAGGRAGDRAAAVAEVPREGGGAAARGGGVEGDRLPRLGRRRRVAVGRRERAAAVAVAVVDGQRLVAGGAAAAGVGGGDALRPGARPGD